MYMQELALNWLAGEKTTWEGVRDGANSAKRLEKHEREAGEGEVRVNASRLPHFVVQKVRRVSEWKGGRNVECREHLPTQCPFTRAFRSWANLQWQELTDLGQLKKRTTLWVLQKRKGKKKSQKEKKKTRRPAEESNRASCPPWYFLIEPASGPTREVPPHRYVSLPTTLLRQVGSTGYGQWGS